MNSDQWSAVDSFITDSLVPTDESLSDALVSSDAGGLPQIQVSAAQAEFLSLLVRIHGATRILEIGTLGAYSTIAMARELPTDGYLLTMEFDAHHAAVAQANVEHANKAHAGLADRVDIRVGPALETLARLADEDPAPFDLFFIDADKENNPNYFQWAVRLARLGSVIVVDNAVRNGSVLDASSSDPAIVGTRKLYDVVGADLRVRATTIQTVGNKGYDGFLIARVERLE